MTRRRSPSTDGENQAAALLALAAAGKTPPGPCLDDEQLALLLDGRSGKNRQEWLAHLAYCPECYQRWRLAGAEHRPRRLAGWQKSRPIGLLLAAAACVALYYQVIKLGESPITPLPMSRPPLSLEKAEPAAEVPPTQAAPPASPLAVPASPPARVAEDKKEAAPLESPRQKGKAPVPVAVAPPSTPAAKSAAPPPTFSPQKEKETVEEGRTTPRQAPPQERRAVAPTMADQAIPSAPAPAALVAGNLGEESLAEWRRELVDACRQGEGDLSRWRALAARGRRLQPDQAAPDDQDKATLATLLALLQGIDSPEAVAPTCRRILVELAKTGADK